MTVPLPLPLDEQHLSSLPQAKRFNLRGLIDCSTGHLSERQSKVGGDISALVCLSISFVGSGAYNYVYHLEFSDGTQLAASVSRPSGAFEPDYSPAAKESEIATMRFVRESGLYPGVSVPQVYAWNTNFENPAGAPYVLMEFIKGKAFNLAVRDDDPGWFHGLRAVPESQQVALVKAMARLKASLSKPVPFSEIGSLAVDSSGTFSVGPLMAINGESLGGPYKSVEDMWRESHEECLLGGIEECCYRTEKNLPSLEFERHTPHDLMDRYQKLSALIPYFKIPEPYTPLVLHHPDLALRNIFFDEESLLSDDPKVACVIDWSGAQILPLMLASSFPLDMMTTFTSPGIALKGPAEMAWDDVPYDWTYFGDPDKTIVREGDSLSEAEAKRIRCEIRLFYLRGLFGAHYGQQIVKLHQGSDLPRATVYLDAQYYLKFHEVMMGSFLGWIVHRHWISEMYWRLRMMPTGNSASGERLVVGPDVYRSTIEPAVVDLGLFEDTPEET
ncbi:hypothetical protein D9611_007965 [Ephemerocybe angulata]|uniref:Aminoglycoside phosphotransferase domain-containing protein n=1 Tax=Ephemerocybe angulata TaxID=980116 RepID=A0A8H5FKR8_9AGAR|nr:hypothetical protein D9611_007965 [Tulosesus angulatus]